MHFCFNCLTAYFSVVASSGVEAQKSTRSQSCNFPTETANFP